MTVMPAWAIWVGGLTVLGTGVVAGWLLLSLFGGGTTQDRVQLEILRLTGSIALGSGGAVALLLAARRQRTAEVDIAQKKRATEDARHDAAERRVTELYTKAAEQLGSDKAAVRLAGLYALERLAQDNPDHRQTIVDVICAYLRMPYTPPPDNTRSSSDERGPHRGLRSPNRRNAETSSMRAVTTLASALSGVADPSQHQYQELEVRKAAERLLTAHLYPEPDENGQPTNGKFWSDVDLDLSGAALCNWIMWGCRVRHATFRGATFYGPVAAFQQSAFQKDAYFDGVTFRRDSWFGGATFHGYVSFAAATFQGDFWEVTFNGTAFWGQASFDKAAFHGDVGFSNAEFSTAAWFDSGVFYRDVRFDGAAFNDVAWFDNAEFFGSVSCGGASFPDATCVKQGVIPQECLV